MDPLAALYKKVHRLEQELNAIRRTLFNNKISVCNQEENSLRTKYMTYIKLLSEYNIKKAIQYENFRYR